MIPATTVLISSEGDHSAPGIEKPYLMIVDGRGVLMDFSGVDGSLTDPSIIRVEWGSVQDGQQIRPGGYITRTDGSRTAFFDKQALAPYLDAFGAHLEGLSTAGSTVTEPNEIMYLAQRNKK